jgi:hypothetical protein
LSFLGVGTQAKRDVVLGKYVSHMHPGTDILVRQSFLLQGQPDSVIGVQFGYDSAVQQDFEDFLFTELNSPPTKAINPLKNTLWFLSGNLYRDHKHVMLVITADNRKVMIPALQRQLNTQKLRPRDEVIVRAELFYLSWKPTSNTNEQLIREVASVKSSVAPIVARNLREVSRQLTIHSSVGKGWERVGIYR